MLECGVDFVDEIDCLVAFLSRLPHEGAFGPGHFLTVIAARKKMAVGIHSHHDRAMPETFLNRLLPEAQARRPVVG